MAKVPDYVSKLTNKNESARFENGVWIVSRRTSYYDKETHKPIPVCKPVAIITPDGRIPYQKRDTATMKDFKSFEFGYSYVLKYCMPKSWVSSLKGDAEAIFLNILSHTSPNSYLLRNVTEINVPKGRNVSMQEERFWAKLGGKEKMQKMLEPLKEIRLLIIDGEMVIQKPTAEQQAILDSVSCKLEEAVVI